MMPDGPNAVRSLALEFTLPNGETWRTGMNDIPVFPVRDARDFYYGRTIASITAHDGLVYAGELSGHFFCCAHCARSATSADVKDRAA